MSDPLSPERPAELADAPSAETAFSAPPLPPPVFEDPPPPAEPAPPFVVKRAWFADALGTTIILEEASGQRWAVSPDDHRLGGVGVSPHVPPPPALIDITARQLRLGLLSLGVRGSQVEQLIEALPGEAREAAQIEWEYGTYYSRAHPLVAQIAGGLGMTEEQLDAAWVHAMGL